MISSRMTSPMHFDEALLEKLRGEFSVEGDIRVVTKYPWYAVSEFGRVFATFNLVSKPYNRLSEVAMHFDTRGYKRVFLRTSIADGVKSKTFWLHRVVAMAFLPPPTRLQVVVRHLDDDKNNNHPTNLAWGTQAENIQDHVRLGFRWADKRKPGEKLTEKEVLAFRLLSEAGWTCRRLADAYGVAYNTAYRILKKKSYNIPAVDTVLQQIVKELS